jgi:DNA repair protein RadA
LKSYQSCTSGSEVIDGVLGGGLGRGRLTLVFGKGNSGKSQLAMQAALCAARAGAKTLYVDTEGAFRPERIEQMALARGWLDDSLLSRITYLRCDSAAEQAEAVRKMKDRKKTSDCRLVVVDTLTRNFSIDLPGNENLPGRQGALGAYLSEMARDAFLCGRAYLLTNRVTFDRRGADVGIGGGTVAQLVHASLHLQREGKMVRITDVVSARGVLVEIGPSGIGAE